MREKLAEIESYLFGSKLKITLLYLVCLVFIGLNCYLVYRQIYWLLMLPVMLVILYLYFYSLDAVILLITLLTPVAVNFTQFEFNVGISLPTEPLMLGVLVMFVVKLFFESSTDKKIWNHPLTILIAIQLVWMLITSLTSSLPMVSVKHLIARLWFVIPFYLLGIHLFMKVKNIRLFLWFYAIPLVGVIFYTTYNHSLWGFNEQAGHWVMEPFYNDHTAYGAVLALYIPVFTGFTFSSVYSRTTRFFSFLVLGILVTAIILSYCRAAWLSLGFAFGIYLIIIFRIKFKWIFSAAIIFGFIFYLFSFQILDTLEKNKQNSSANFVEHLRSISNISTDASNLERINRWQSAIRMYEDRPVFGYGPGTYQFEYAPFQRSEEKTLISTNAGDRGNAHSEFIGPMAEQGIPGILLMIAVVAMMLITGMRVYRNARNREVKMLGLVVMLSLVTYFIHGTMNNFLDTDKASVPVWGMAAILVALEIFNKRENQGEEQIPAGQ
jgi:putative inorganic carbon (HCO3(-)) transporter